MPGRLRQSTVRSPVTTNEQQSYSIPGLQFSETLTWKAGKAIAVGDLLSRLQDLASELRGLEQGQISANHFRKLAQDLSHSNLLGHKDKGVRACTLCCIVDILSVCAPDAPFNPAQLKDIFTVIVSTILPALADPSNAYNAQHVYILNSLVDTKSIVLITDLVNAESFIIPLFTICFDIVSGAGQSTSGVELAKSVEFQLRTMLVTIIDEVTLPQEATDIILSQFLRVDPRTVSEMSGKKKTEKDKKQDTIHLKDYPPAYNMAKSICTTCPDKMAAQVTQYFGNILMNASASLEGSDGAKIVGRRQVEFEDLDNEDESIVDLRKAHRLAKELWRACPDILLNVIPQIESELSADSAALRQLATETIGDMIAGIGISGPPPTTPLDPATYPLPSILEPEPAPLITNPLLIPASPKPFGSVHGTTFQAFLGRRLDKSAAVRSAWVLGISRILLTDAGGIGIGEDDRKRILESYAQTLQDVDDRVRMTAIESISQFNYHGVVNILGSDTGLAKSGTVLSNLTDRVSDRKGNVREQAMITLGRIWGVASRDLSQGEEKIVSMLGDIPSRLLNAMYVNDVLTNVLVDRVLYEDLLPLAYPPAKLKPEGQSKRGRNSSSQDASSVEVDHIRVLRILTLVKSLDDRARLIFLRLQKRQMDMAKAMKLFLKACEDYNGGVVENDKDEQKLKDILTLYIQGLSRQFPDQSRLSSDLWKFARMHDRRSYQLIRFAIGPEYDYKTMTKAIKELVKRVREGSGSSQSLAETLLPILYRCALVVYNRSHIPGIMEISRDGEAGLADTAHALLKDISATNPEVLKSHIQALCKELQENAPSVSKAESTSAADTLKACSGFARKYPGEVPKDRKFLTALIEYAVNSHSYRAAKHAVTIALTVSDRKELHAKEIMSKAIKDCKPSNPHYLAHLAAISQVCLYAPAAAAAEEKAILKIAVTDCLHKNQDSSKTEDLNAWEEVPTDETVSKQLALRIMVNRCRALDEKQNPESFDELAQTILAILIKLIQNSGEIATNKDTPPAQRNQLRLTAARLILKLCSHKQRCEELVTPEMFMTVALVVINPPNAVRSGFVSQLRKCLGRNVLHQRWHTVLFLLAFEPDEKLKNGTVSWLKSRVQQFARQQKQGSGNKQNTQPVMESLFARLLSLLAHHPDYPDAQSELFENELLDFAKYIIFYLQAVATEENLSLIFHIAQRVKQTQDNITNADEMSTRLYVLSDLSQATIRHYADLMPAHAKGANLLQTYPGRVTMPSTLFAALPNAAKAHEIAAKNFLPEDVASMLSQLVRKQVKAGKVDKVRKSGPDRKRKSSMSVDLDDDDDNDDEKSRSVKKSRKASLPIRRTPKAKVKAHSLSASVEPSRKSARVSTSTNVNYAESDDDAEENVHAPSSPTQKSARSSARRVRTGSNPIQSEDEADDADEDVEMSHTNGHDQVDEEELDAVDDDHTPSPAKTGRAGRSVSQRVKTNASVTKSTMAKEKTTDAPKSNNSTPVTRRSTRGVRA